MFIRPYDAYDNVNDEGYGEIGGQDIIILKLRKNSIHKPMCLPSIKSRKD